MTGNASTLVKVISAVLKFTPQQTQVVLEKEHQRHTLVREDLEFSNCEGNSPMSKIVGYSHPLANRSSVSSSWAVSTRCYSRTRTGRNGVSLPIDG